MMADVIVIGGGVIGSSVTYRLAQAGARVTLLEARRLSGGTSSTSFAWMNSNNKAPLEYHRLNVGGMSEHSILREEFGVAPWLHVYGNVIWGDESRATAGAEPDVPVVGESLEAKIRRLREWSYPVEVLSPSQLSYVHPDIKPPDDVERITLYPTEGYVDVPLLIANLTRAAENYGAVIQTNQEVVDIVREAGRVVGVRTAAGDQIAADVVVSCTGRWTDQVTALTGARIPMAPTLGLLVVSSPAVIGLRSLVHTPRVNVRPDGGSRIMMASFELDSLLKTDSSPEALSDLAQQVLERATAILPALHGSTVEAFKLGVRAIPQDGFPVIGPLGGVDGFYTISTHSGVTMGPLLGRIATKEILGGEIDDRVASFRPDRLIAAHAASV
jgi:glycine/D-amino acid oxidase-like deaminating enzyme